MEYVLVNLQDVNHLVDHVDSDNNVIAAQWGQGILSFIVKSGRRRLHVKVTFRCVRRMPRPCISAAFLSFRLSYAVRPFTRVCFSFVASLCFCSVQAGALSNPACKLRNCCFRNADSWGRAAVRRKEAHVNLRVNCYGDRPQAPWNHPKVGTCKKQQCCRRTARCTPPGRKR